MAASKSLTPEQRSQRARIAAHAMHSKNDSKEVSAAARAAFEKKFHDEVDPARSLPEAERLRRVEHAKSAYYSRLAFASSKARSKGRRSA